MEEILVRKMAFAFPDDLELVFIRGEPGLSYTFVGTWMLLPYLEPYLIRAMREALPRIESPGLREDVQRFCAQEGQHYREHARANDAIRTRRPASRDSPRSSAKSPRSTRRSRASARCASTSPTRRVSRRSPPPNRARSSTKACSSA